MRCSYGACANEAVEGIKLCQKHREQKAAWNRKYDEQNREKRAEYARWYRKEYPERAKASCAKRDKNKKSQYQKIYTEKNKAKLKEYRWARHLVNYAFNAEKIKARNSLWSKQNKEKQADRVMRYRVRKREAFVSEVDRVEVFERDGWMCKICGLPVLKEAPKKHPLGASLDHIVPLSRGGKHHMGNVQCTHLECNLKKNNKLPHEVRQ